MRVAATMTACRVHYEQQDAPRALADALCSLLSPWGAGRPLVFLCIGTDRSTGDALGPLVGQALRAWRPSGATVVGCLDEPVHATNLGQAMARLREAVPDGVVVAVDACLGRLETVGTITVGAGPLCPGAGVNKALPEVGDAHVTGTVNVGGFMEYFVLQNTRLSLVVRMAEVVAEGLAAAARQLRAPAAEREAAPALA